MSQLKILRESEIDDRADALAACWQAPPTFIVAPDKGVTPEWLAQAADQVPERLRTGCFGILTSGSTGEPKLVLGERKRTERLVRVLHELQGGEPVRETVCALPLSYSYAFVNQWAWAHVFDRRVRVTAGFAQADRLESALASAEDAMLCLVGSQVPLIRSFFPDAVFPGVIRLHFAGGRFPQEHLEFLRARFPNAQIFNNYGCAEAMPRLTLRRAEDATEAARVGPALPGVEMQADPEKRLLFRSPYRAVAFVDGDGFHFVPDDEWLPTGDLGEQLPDGSWRLLGRAGDVFKRFGEKVSLPAALTTVRTAWEGDLACYRESDPAGEEGYVLILSPEPGAEQLRRILMAFRAHHSRPHWPLRIESLEEMPLLPNGKPDLMRLGTVENRKLHWRQRI